MHLNTVIKSIAGGNSSAHAYIVEGKDVSAREDFIKRLAMGLECLSADIDSRPCGICDACRQAAAGSSMDIVRMQMSGKTGYKTEDANAFSNRLDMEAYGRYLIGIIDDADSMSETVQNKLLKTLEEPRPSVILLLGTSNPDHLLSTVRSRCSTIRVQSDPEAESTAGERNEAFKALAEMMGASGSEFYMVRDSIESNIKSSGDARALIEAAEDIFRDKMRSADTPLLYAAKIEKCERAAADIEMGMDKAKALKRLFIELGTVR